MYINETASYDPALWTTINFYGPKAVPSFALATAGNSKGNLANVDDPKAPTATIYSVNGSYVTFDITSIEGVEADALTGYKAEKVATNGFVQTFKVSVDTEASADGGNMVFKNAGDPTKTTTLTITKADPSLSVEKSTDANSASDYTATNHISGTLKIDLDLLSTESCSFKVNAPQGSTVASLDCPWLSITETHTWTDSDGERYAEYQLKQKESPANTNDFNLVFTNRLTEKGITAPGFTLTLNKAYSKPKLEAATTGTASVFNEAISFTDNNTGTVNMYKAADSKIYVKMTCPEGATFENVSGLNITNNSGEYEIKVTDASQLSDATTVITAKNSSDATRTATLTITWLDPAITFEKTLDTANAAAIEGDNINVTGSTFKDSYGTIKIKVKGYKGSTITISDVTNTWAGIANPPTEIGEDGTAEITITAATAGNADETGDITITVTNAVTNGSDKTITLKKVTAP